MAPRVSQSPLPPFPVRAVAGLALIVAVPARRLPLRWLLAAVSTLRCLPPASSQFVAMVDRAVRAARPTWWPGRIACMEISLATLLAVALCGRRAHWVFGSRPLPNEAHAWVQTADGQPFGLDDDDPVRPWVAVSITPHLTTTQR
ncbi:lasso peptide biosynthesis B2 protein [Streptomyces tubercidicus]|uniref:lasso peptide biosynthesis B2 protein n=1 Tax=Streptomyces tubercidicus TaxID=47759 RepID=UPI003794DC1F